MNFIKRIQPINQYFNQLTRIKFGNRFVQRKQDHVRSSTLKFTSNSLHFSALDQLKWFKDPPRGYSSSRKSCASSELNLSDRREENKNQDGKLEDLVILPNSLDNSARELVPVAEGKEEQKEKKEEDEKEKEKKKDKKLRLIFIKQMIKYGIQGFLGAIIAWLLGWYPDVIQQELDGPRVRARIQSENETKLDIGDHYQPRGKVDQNLTALFGNHDRDWAKIIIVIGPPMSGKTWALKNAAAEQEMVVWVNASTVKTEQEFAQKFYQSLGLWFTPPVLSHAFEFFGRQCKFISNSRADGKVPTLIIEDLNFGNESHQELIQVILSQAVKLGADKRYCRVILTASDHLIAAPELEHLVNRSGKVKLFEIGDFASEEARNFLNQGSDALDKTPKKPWRLSEEQKNMIIDQVGEKPGILKSVLEEIDQRIDEDTDGTAEAVEKTIKNHTKRAEMIVDAAFSLFPEAEHPLRRWAKEGWKSGKTAMEARKLFGYSPEDKEGKLFKVLMDQKRILTWNASNGTVRIASKPLWNHLKEK
eukprot:TRINITY_DN6470_c0_g1_i1.p1 TRINITY_DN6470_c0_g1~~TRINITY_DN6470_c0_g1_i1.p1  ORF type:complete len:533 (-),score=165.47 TRINITY_DN6470_c0_g1_i1:74-1672(-)